MRTLRLILLSLLLLGAAPASFTPYRVKDINPVLSPGSSDPSDFVTLGNVALFSVTLDFYTHSELWRSDGTASGTYRLAQIGFFRPFAVTGDRYFLRSESSLWVTDGTLPGTFSLGEFSYRPAEGPATWVPEQGVLYFSAEVPGLGHGTELWRSDGTPGGTYEVLDIVPGSGSSNPTSLVSLQGRLYFRVGCALWRSDGTAAGTLKVQDVCAGSLHAVGSRLVFVGGDSKGRELWASDGTTAGTRRIADLTMGFYSTTFHDFQVVGKRLFFTATASDRGEELYVTDGTAQGTKLLTWLSDPEAFHDFPGYVYQPPEWGNSLPMTPLGNRLFFWAYDPAYGVELWSSDGTPKGTRMVRDTCPGSCSSSLSSLHALKGRLYYLVDNGTVSQLWVTDGTAQGTQKVKDFPGWIANWSHLGTANDRLFYVHEVWPVSVWTTDGTADGTTSLAEFYFNPDREGMTVAGTVAGGVLMFQGRDDEHGRELWRSDGTPAGTQFLFDIADEDLGGSYPRDLMTLGESVLFFADDGDGYALWRSDGTEAGTTVVTRDLVRTSWMSWTSSATRVYFVPFRHRYALWTSDGTKAGTLRVTPSGVRSLGELSAPVIKLGSRVFFSAWNPKYGGEPWITDGTPAGTRLVADLRPGPRSSLPSHFTVFAEKAWFAASFRLWKSDGTAQGTVALGPELLELEPRTAYGGRLWFTGRNNGGEVELWSTQGTAATTVRIAELGTLDSLLGHAGRLWFLAEGSELWSTDGTAAGTRKLDLPVSSGKTFQGLMTDGVRLYVDGGEQGLGLWVSDGTAAGTRKISDQGNRYKDSPWTGFAGRLYYGARDDSFHTSDGTAAGTRPVRPDGEPRGAYSLLHFGNQLVAANYDELWRSDGTAEGTKLIRDHVGGDVEKAGSRLFFPAWDEETGWELWAMRE
jgi:ELWxxDGT repeat protein